MPQRVPVTAICVTALLLLGSVLCSAPAEGAWLDVGIDPAGVEVVQGDNGEAVFRCQGVQCRRRWSRR
jgi:hypothetical protein